MVVNRCGFFLITPSPVIPTESRTTLSEAEGEVRLSGGAPTLFPVTCRIREFYRQPAGKGFAFPITRDYGDHGDPFPPSRDAIPNPARPLLAREAGSFGLLSATLVPIAGAERVRDRLRCCHA
jgi:hypothetical protein